MISLRKVFGRIMSTHADVSVEVEGKASASHLLRLPPEIILLIASMLPTPSAACFALCSRRFSHTLGPGCWRSLLSETLDVRLAFLSVLSRDLPRHFICQDCACLHRMSSVKWPRVITRNLGPLCQRLRYRPLSLSRYEIYFHHIQLAIKQHHSNTDIGFPLEAFQHLEVEHDPSEQKTTLLSVDAQIISHELLMRSQTWILLPWDRRDEFVDGLAKNGLSNDICVHTRIGFSFENPVPDLVKSRLAQLETQEKCRTQTLKCPGCWMDYVFDAIDFGERGFAILVTRWINLGAGLDVSDAKWLSHVTLQKAKVHHIHFPGDIRASFEDQAEVSEEELTTENKLKLLSRRKNRLVSRGSDELLWKWDRGKRWYLAPSGPPETVFSEF